MSRFYDDYQQPEPDARFNSAIKTLIIQIISTAIITIYVVLCCTYARAAITGPESGAAGELTVLESDIPASWAIHPVEFINAIYPVDGGAKCIFASPKTGVVTFFAATIVDGKPVISSHVLYNGVDGPTPSPEPTPPTPVPTTLESVAKTELAKITTATKREEQAAMVDALENVISGIERGTIQTTQGARATFRGVWAAKAAQISADTPGAWANWLTAVSEKLDQTDVQTLKAGFVILKNVLKSGLKPGNEIPLSRAPEPAANKPKSGCVNGNCQTPVNGRFFQWRR